MKNAREVILAPVVSEKSYDLIEHRRTYTFIVDRRSNKSEIRDAVKEIFDVDVVSVNTINRQGKRKRTGWVYGKRQDTKRALVTIGPDQTIDLFGA